MQITFAPTETKYSITVTKPGWLFMAGLDLGMVYGDVLRQAWYLAAFTSAIALLAISVSIKVHKQ